MRPDLADITIVLDRSGSMEACRAQAEAGLNGFVLEQRAERGEAVLTLVQFDTEYEFVHRAVPIAAVPRLVLEPRGGTALLDAVGRAILETGQRLAATPEPQRPGLVAFVILTDGQENSSREFTREKVRSMIEHQRAAYSWQFTFLGANQDAFAEAGSLGIAAGTTANFTQENAGSAFQGASNQMKRKRASTFFPSAATPDDDTFTAEEREDMRK